MTTGGGLHDGFLRAVAATPDKAALVCGDTVLTYRDLNHCAGRIAAEIDRRLARRVALCLSNGPHVIDAFLGTVMAGACVCLYDPGWPASLLQDLTDEHEPHVVIADDTCRAALNGLIPTDALWSAADLADITSGDSPPQALRSQPMPDMPFLLGFTSGSSGRPKAFIRAHQTWADSFAYSAQELGTSANSCVVAPGPLSHGLSLYAVIETLCAGGTAVIHTHFDAAAVLEGVEEHKATALVIVPAMLDVLLDMHSSSALSSVTAIITAGAKLPPALRRGAADVFPNADIIEYYGASELSFVTVAKGRETPPAESVGRAFAGVEIDVRDETGASLPPARTGTVWVRSSMICTGYVGATDGSGLRKSGGWATVGDLGHRDENGFLYLDGREGSAITSAGYTVYPSAIESALLSHPDVQDAVAIGLPHPRWGEVIAAAVAPVSGRTLEAGALETHCQELLEPYACPRRWVITEGFSRTTSGKPVRADVVALFSDGG